MNDEDERIERTIRAAVKMIADCDKQIAEGRESIMVVLGNRRPPTGLRVRLAPQGGPLGEVMNYQEVEGSGEIVARFDPKRIRNFLAAELHAIGEVV